MGIIHKAPLQDNSTFPLKVKLRRRALKQLAEEPVVIETHAGFGRLYSRCYKHVVRGVAFEIKAERTGALALQRPTWAIYEGDCIPALAAGIGSHLTANFIDIDPYGEPWPTIDALFSSKRTWPQRLVVVVNDGLRHKVRIGAGWKVKSLRAAIERHGNAHANDHYLEICRELMAEKAGQAGYELVRWSGYHCGRMQMMTHYAAVFERR